MLNYKNWYTFKFRGKEFLALYTNGNEVFIYGPGFQNYGSYFSVESFKKMYFTMGESLNLSNAVA